MPTVVDQTELRQSKLQRALPGLAALPTRVIRWAVLWLAHRFERRRPMRHLSELDDYLLRDIGLPRPNIWGGSAGGSATRDSRLKP